MYIRIRELPLEKKQELHINIDKSTGKTDMKCFIEEMQTFYVGRLYLVILEWLRVFF